MKKISTLLTAILASASPCAAQFIVDQRPTRFGGPASDTEFVVSPPHIQAQLIADDFALAQADTLRAVIWWGFYNADNPPPVEVMRLRVYDARSSDGLPGTILYEEMFSDAQRTPTGRTIIVSGSPREFRYKVVLSQPLSLLPSTRYWTELVQIGDPASAFRWENAFPGDGFAAAKNPATTDWYYIMSPSGGLDQAFQLIAPEPATLALFGLAGALRPRRPRRPR